MQKAMIACVLWLGGVALAEETSAQKSTTVDQKSLEEGRQLTQWFYTGDTSKVWERLAPQLKGAIGSPATLVEYRRQLTDQLGSEVKTTDEKTTPMNGLRVYQRDATFEHGGAQVTWSLDDKGRVANFALLPTQSEAPSKFVDRKTKTDLRLPFGGAWTVQWGGRTAADNYHVANAAQRFGYDFVVKKNGQTHDGDGKKNEQYYDFGQPVLAPGAGTVVAVVDGVVDNEPGKINTAQLLGNHVVIDHGNGEFSVLAHLEKDSLKVKVKDKVKAGQEVAACGNSGNSGEPHLHYHLQNGKTEIGSVGLPAQFARYAAGGQTALRGEPRRGVTVEKK